jgi:protein tyrosine/serine phosphatase
MKDFLSLWLIDHGFLRLLYRNVHRLPGALYRSNQPSPTQLRNDVRRLGIKTVINLRGGNPSDGFYRLERAACDALQLILEDVEVWSRGLLSREQILALRSLIDEIELPGLAHCKSGADRAGYFAVLYRHFRLGEPIEMAMTELDWRYGHFKSAQTGVLDYFFESYLNNRKPRQGFLSWVADGYERKHIERAFKPKGLVRWFVDVILRRE